MGCLVCGGAMLQCSFGAAPSTLMVLPVSRVNGAVMPYANVMANLPFANILPFGMCSSMSNPTVAAATAAALGVLTPMPCIPVLTAPWSPGSPTVEVGGQKALNQSSKLNCAWGGVIQIVQPGQFTVQVP